MAIFILKKTYPFQKKNNFAAAFPRAIGVATKSTFNSQILFKMKHILKKKESPCIFAWIDGPDAST